MEGIVLFAAGLFETRDLLARLPQHFVDARGGRGLRRRQRRCRRKHHQRTKSQAHPRVEINRTGNCHRCSWNVILPLAAPGGFHSLPLGTTLYLMPTKRRTFLKQVTLASAAATQSAAQIPSPPAAAPTSPAAPEIVFPRVFTGRRLTAIAFPLGGVCSGCVSLV